MDQRQRKPMSELASLSNLNTATQKYKGSACPEVRAGIFVTEQRMPNTLLEHDELAPGRKSQISADQGSPEASAESPKYEQALRGSLLCMTRQRHPPELLGEQGKRNHGLSQKPRRARKGGKVDDDSGGGRQTLENAATVTNQSNRSGTAMSVMAQP